MTFKAEYITFLFRGASTLSEKNDIYIWKLYKYLSYYNYEVKSSKNNFRTISALNQDFSNLKKSHFSKARTLVL